MSKKPTIKISYCPKCKWLIRAAWYAQELLSTFEQEVGEVGLIPSEVPGHFQIALEGSEVWCRKANGGFPEITELKRKIRDLIAPSKDLGHSDSNS